MLERRAAGRDAAKAEGRVVPDRIVHRLIDLVMMVGIARVGIVVIVEQHETARRQCLAQPYGCRVRRLVAVPVVDEGKSEFAAVGDQTIVEKMMAAGFRDVVINSALPIGWPSALDCWRYIEATWGGEDGKMLDRPGAVEMAWIELTS